MYKEDNIFLYNEDFLRTSYKYIENSSIDLIITSPPYNLEIEYETYDDKIAYDDYLLFSNDWLYESYLLAKDDGRLCLNTIINKTIGGQQSIYTDLTTIAKKVGWKYHFSIVWLKQNVSRRTAWGSWMSASAPYVMAPAEMIGVFYKERWKKDSRGISDITREEFIEWTNGLWSFNSEKAKKIGHPAPFPTELPKRCIKLFSYVGDTILDPFVGSGTTLVECKRLNRIGIGFEIDKTYCDITQNRLIEVNNTPIAQLVEQTPDER